MDVALLEIDGFRGIASARLPLQKHAVLVGTYI